MSELEIWVVGQSSEQVEEGLLVLVVRLRGHVIVLDVDFSVENNLSGLHLSVFGVDLNLHTNATLFPTNTIGMLSQILVKSLCHLGTFLYEIRDVTSNMIMAQ